MLPSEGRASWEGKGEKKKSLKLSFTRMCDVSLSHNGGGEEKGWGRAAEARKECQ